MTWIWFIWTVPCGSSATMGWLGGAFDWKGSVCAASEQSGETAVGERGRRVCGSPYGGRGPHGEFERSSVGDLTMAKPGLIERLSVDGGGLDVVVEMLGVEVLRYDAQRLAGARGGCRLRETTVCR